MGENPKVLVDYGDLSEIQQAAEAWAGYLRKRAGFTADRKTDNEAADRIDAANSRTRQDAYESAGKEK
jgi:hypothetical protein